MTVPMDAEPTHLEGVSEAEVMPVARTRPARRRKLYLAGLALVAVAGGVVILVMAYPILAAPIGTSAGVVAAVFPFVQRMTRAGAPGDVTEDEPQPPDGA
ncbi:hypothetical protein [Streptomyces sp. NPDC057636]|uniref:hypothetical protein n=1 Tax=Streptomyces sp. NPDC057636 TaxID=3346189 RepID=UPI00367F5CC9